MTTFNPGEGATISATSVEQQTAGHIWLIQALEASPANPTGINYLTSSSSDDPGGELSAELALPVQTTVANDGTVTIVTPPPFASVSYSSGNGNMSASNPWQALVWLSIKQANLEILQKADSFVTWGIAGSATGVAGTNATFSATYKLPTTFAVDGTGQQVRTAKEYLS